MCIEMQSRTAPAEGTGRQNVPGKINPHNDLMLSRQTKSEVSPGACAVP